MKDIALQKRRQKDGKTHTVHRQTQARQQMNRLAGRQTKGQAHKKKES